MTAIIQPPRINISDVPRMNHGMGNEAAYKNGYRHGYEGVCTLNVCSLTKGTAERNEWMRGYLDGSGDRSGV